MEFNENTRIADLIAAYPWLPDAVAQMDPRLRIVNTPIGKALIRRVSGKILFPKSLDASLFGRRAVVLEAGLAPSSSPAALSFDISAKVF